MRKVLEIPAFRRLLVVTILNEVALAAGAVALALLVYRRTGSAFGATAFFLCAEFGPAFFAPALVARFDGGSVRRVLVVLFAFEGLIFLILAWLLDSFAVVSLLALVLLDGTFGVTARVLTRAAWISVTSIAGLLRPANAVVHAARSVCFMVGPAAGGAVVAAGGTRLALLLDAGAFALAIGVTASARGLPHAVAERTGTERRRIRQAIARVRAEPVLRRLLGLQAVGMLFFTITIPVDVVLAQRTFHAGAGGYGLLLAAWGAGTILGSAAYARWRTNASRNLITAGTLAIGGGFLVMAAAPKLGVAVSGSGIAGVGTGLQGAAMRTALQEAIPSRWMALILSLNESIFQAVPGAGMLLGGGITALAGVRTALAVAASGSLLIAAVVWLRLGSDVRPAAAFDLRQADAEAGVPAAVRQD